MGPTTTVILISFWGLFTQLIPGLSPTGRFTTLLPLCIVISVTAIKELIEDIVCNSLHKRTTNCHYLLMTVL